MTTRDESQDPQRSGSNPAPVEAKGNKGRLMVLIGLLALALFALWYDYKVARPAVEQAYDRITAANDEINAAAEHRRMTNVDVQTALKRTPNETFPNGLYTVEAYRWRAGLPIEFRGFNAGESPGIGLKTFDYFAIYRKEGPDLAFITHFKFKLDQDYFVETKLVDNGEVPVDAAVSGMGGFGGGPGMEGAPGMGAGGPGMGGPGGGGPGGGGFDPNAFFAERDADGDGKLTGDEISERLRGRMDEVDTDGDGAVSKEEFIAGRSQGGGRGGPGGAGTTGEGEGRRQRPPLEAETAPTGAALEESAPTTESPAVPSAENSEATSDE